MLALDGVVARRGPAQILFGVSLAVGAGEAVALVGRNGAGKTTTLRCILGLLPVAAGAIHLDGRDITGLPTHHIVRLGVGYVPEDRRVFPDLTVAENLEVGRLPPRPPLPPWTEERAFALFPALAPLRRRRAGTLSGGEQQMLVVARTLLGNPRLLLLDEPAEGLAPVVVEQMAAALAEVKRQGMAILLSEQNLHLATALCDRAYLLEKGRVRAEAAVSALAGDPALLADWLAV